MAVEASRDHGSWVLDPSDAQRIMSTTGMDDCIHHAQTIWRHSFGSRAENLPTYCISQPNVPVRLLPSLIANRST